MKFETVRIPFLSDVSDVIQKFCYHGNITRLLSIIVRKQPLCF